MSIFRSGQGRALSPFMMVAALGLSLGLASSAMAVGASVQLSLDNPTVSDTQVSVDVMALISADTTEAINSFGLDVSSSSSSLAPGGDYSGFSFALDPSLTSAGWLEASVDATDPFFDYTTFDPFGPLPASPTPYSLGTLSVDITPLAPGESATVSIFDPLGNGTFAFYELFPLQGQPVIGPADISFGQPFEFEFTRPEDDDGGDNGGGEVIPEPASMMLAGLAIAALTGAATRRRRA